MKHTIPLYPNPPFSPRPSEPSDESDFPPILIRKSSSDPPSPPRSPPSSHVRHHPPAARTAEHIGNHSPPRPTRSTTLDKCSRYRRPSPKIRKLLTSRSSDLQTSQKRQNRLPKHGLGLGHQNIVNAPNSTSKRQRSGVTDSMDDRPLKRKCLTFIDEDDMDWLKGEISDIKRSILELGVLLQPDALLEDSI